MFKFLVIEDHALVREGLMQTVGTLSGDPYPLGASDVETALAQLALHPDVDLILLDLMLPGLNGMSLLSVLRKRYPLSPIVVLSALEEPDTVRKAMRHGASGFVGKSNSGEVLLGALRKVLSGETFIDEKYAPLDDKPVRAPQVRFTPTQTRVLDLLAEGYSNREIAELLGVTVGTVKMHFFAIYKILNVNSRAQALVALKKLKLRL